MWFFNNSVLKKDDKTPMQSFKAAPTRDCEAERAVKDMYSGLASNQQKALKPVFAGSIDDDNSQFASDEKFSDAVCQVKTAVNSMLPPEITPSDATIEKAVEAVFEFHKDQKHQPEFVAPYLKSQNPDSVG